MKWIICAVSIAAFFAYMVLYFSLMDRQSPFEECVETHYFQAIEKSKIPAKDLWMQAGEQCAKLEGNNANSD